MSASVNIKPAKIDPTFIKSNGAVRSQTWQDTSQVLNLAMGHGAVLMPVTSIGETVGAQGTLTYRIRARPTLGVSSLKWLFGIRSTAPNVSFTTSLGTSGRISVNSAFGNASTSIIETYSGGVSSDIEYSISFTAHTTASLTIDYIGLYESPRAALDASEGGIDINAVLVGNPILDKATEGYSAIARSIEAAPSRTRRVGHMHWLRSAGHSVNGTTMVPQLHLPSPVLNRKLNATGTSRTISFRVYAKATGSTSTGRVQLTTGKFPASPVSITVNNGPDPAWYPLGAPAQIFVDSEASGTVNGLQSGTFDTLQLAFGNSLAAGTVTVYAVSVWEDEQDI